MNGPFVISKRGILLAGLYFSQNIQRLGLFKSLEYLNEKLFCDSQLILNQIAVVSGWGNIFQYSRELTQKILLTFNVFGKKLRKLKVNIANDKCTDLGIATDPKMQLCAGGYKGKS